MAVHTGGEEGAPRRRIRERGKPRREARRDFLWRQGDQHLRFAGREDVVEADMAFAFILGREDRLA